MLRWRLSLLVGVLLCVTGGCLVLGGASAFALNTYVLSGSFGGSGAGALSEPSGIAVNNETGNVYVVDRGHNRVQEFDSSGTLLGEFDGAAAGHPLSGPEGIAVDNSTNPLDPSAGDVYVADAGHDVVDKFTATGSYVGQLTETTGGASFGELYGAAVDPSGVVWVYQASGEIDSFSDALSNVFVSQRSSPFGTSAGFAVDSGDNLYVNRGVKVFAKLNSAGEVLGGEVDPGSSTAAAVNTASGEVFIDDAQSIGTYDASGGFLSRFGEGNLSSSVGVAVNPVSGVVYATDAAANLVDAFEEGVVPDVTTGGASGVQGTSATLHGTVNPDGIPITSCVFEYGTDTSYGQSVSCASNPGSGTSPVALSAEPSGLQEGTTYHYRLRAANAGGAHSGEDQTFITMARPSIDAQSSGAVTQTTASLHAQINPHGLATAYHFEYGTSTAYGTSVPAPDGNLTAGNGDQEAATEITGLQAATVYHYRTVAVNSLGTSTATDGTFTTEPPLQIDSVSARDITASDATLDARIDPRGVDTSYRFEYGTSTVYGTSIPVSDGDVGSATGDVSVSQHLTGLTANTTYHYRVTAHNALGTQTSADHTFVYSTVVGGLPDGRAYEMVTPVQKNGALIGFLANAPEPGMDVAESGLRLVAPVSACLAGAGSCVPQRGGTAGASYEFQRTPGGWATSSLSLANGALENVFLLSADSGKELLALPNGAGKEDLYAMGEGGSLAHIGPAGPPATGRSENAELGSSGHIVATSDMSHVVWSTSQGEYRWPFDFTMSTPPSTYEYVGTDGVVPAMVGVTGGAGSTDLVSICGTEIPGHQPGALSADGRVVFFVASACSTGSGANAGVAVPANQLWARVDESRSMRISARSPSDCSGGCATSTEASPEFMGASADGGRAFFTSVQQLTNDASQDTLPGDERERCYRAAGVNGCNLYLYDFSRATGENLIDISAGDSSGGGPRVRGVMAMSSDGSHVYFVAQGVLTQAANDRGESAKSGANNLYVYERDAAYPEGHTIFITGLPGADVEEWEPGESLANVTPDGRFLVFRSRGDLTADDTSLSGARQLFRYDAQNGQLIRISVGDLGFDDNGNRSFATPCSVGGVSCSEDVHLAGSQNSHSLFADPRRDLTMSHDGSYVFFTSPVALAPGALDDVQAAIGAGLEEQIPRYAQNVYEWHDGRVYLISDGKDIGQHLEFSVVALMGTDATGANVFFSTADPLVPQDTDTQVDIYDARICTVAEPCVQAAAPAEACQGDACHAPPAPAPGSASVASSTLTGAGNLTPAPAAAGHKKTVVKKEHAKPRKRKKKARRGHKARIRHTSEKSGARS